MRERLKRMCRSFGASTRPLLDRLLGQKPPKRCVLLVDDIPEVPELMAVMLEGFGFEIHTAKNGVEALHLARCLRPDLIIMNFIMPEMDGLTALKVLKKDPILRNLKVVIHSALGRDPAFQRQAFDLGALGCFAVPFSSKDFLAVVRRALPDLPPKP